jgi:hypothetical protein
MLKTFILILGAVNAEAFIKAPLRHIAVSRAITSTLTEAIAINVFDVSALVHEIACDCDQHPYTVIYISGFVVFSYLYITKGNDDDRLKNFEFYTELKKNMRFVLIVMFLVMGKNVENAI